MLSQKLAETPSPLLLQSRATPDLLPASPPSPSPRHGCVELELPVLCQLLRRKYVLSLRHPRPSPDLVATCLLPTSVFLFLFAVNTQC